MLIRSRLQCLLLTFITEVALSNANFAISSNSALYSRIDAIDKHVQSALADSGEPDLQTSDICTSDQVWGHSPIPFKSSDGNLHYYVVIGDASYAAESSALTW